MCVCVFYFLTTYNCLFIIGYQNIEKHKRRKLTLRYIHWGSLGHIKINQMFRQLCVDGDVTTEKQRNKVRFLSITLSLIHCQTVKHVPVHEGTEV